MAQVDLIQTIDQFEAEYRKGIGTVLPYRPTKEANLDNIRRFGDGVGDYNPLWRDEGHAAQSRFGMITAPPPFLYSVTLGRGCRRDRRDRPAPGVHAVPAGQLRWCRNRLRPPDLAERSGHRHRAGGRDHPQAQRSHRPDQLQYRLGDVHQSTPRSRRYHQDHDGALREHRAHAGLRPRGQERERRGDRACDRTNRSAGLGTRTTRRRDALL